MFEAVSTRLQDRVPTLRDCVYPVSDFVRLMSENQTPVAGVAAYVIATGLTGQPASAAAGFYVQPVQRQLSVVLFLMSVDRTGARAIDAVDTLTDDVLAALCGWAPDDTVGVFELQRARIVPSQHRSLLAYQFEFRIQDQLRITP